MKRNARTGARTKKEKKRVDTRSKTTTGLVTKRTIAAQAVAVAIMKECAKTIGLDNN